MSSILVVDRVQSWFNALIGSTLVALVGLFPLLVVPNQQRQKEEPCLQILLSMSVGSQLANVFLHLLPESFSHDDASSLFVGIWTIIGILTFRIIEQIFHEDYFYCCDSKVKHLQEKKIKTIGYLNVLANFFDNLTHGASIGGSFAVDQLLGVTTVLAILIHEIPHEIGDFAILRQSGFDRWQAAKAQIVTALAAIIGASSAFFYSNLTERTLWVLPFTSGAFIYISLVKTVPLLLKKNDFKHTFRQFIGLIAGFLLIYFLIIYLQ